ncbi:MAG: hypothetical protein VX498_05820, partial [Myxococcota bacterium]|nr:hypothetical protein [Myxococcota bacterium]
VLVAAGGVRRGGPRDPRLALFLGSVFLAGVVALPREPWVAALGLRVFAPMALVLLASSALRKQEHFTRLVAFARGLAARIVVLTVLQRFLGVAFRTWCTQLSPDWCRAFSVYTHANILAAFLVVSFVLLLTYQGLSPAVRIVGTLSLFGAVFLTRSGIGFPSLLACGALWAATRWERSRARWGLLLFLPALGSLPALAWLTGRSNIWISVSDRVTILWRLVMEGSLTELFFGRGLGYGANTSASLSKITGMQAQDVFVADSLYISLLAQIGLLGLAAFVALNLRLLTLAWRLRGDAVADTMLVLIPVLGLLSTTTVVLEVVPINWLYWIGCGALLCRPADLQEQQQAIPPPTSDKTDGPGPGDENHVHALLGSPLQSQTHP